MSNESSIVSNFVFRARLLHISCSLEWMLSGDEGDFPHFMGDERVGFFCRVGAEPGDVQALAWDEQGLVALAFDGQLDEGGAIGSQKEWERDPERLWRDAPVQLSHLVRRVTSHLLVQRMATAGYWLTTQRPAPLEPLKADGMEALRPFGLEPEAALKGWSAGLPKEVWPVAIDIEAASRGEHSYSIGAEQGEALMPRSWFRKRAKLGSVVGAVGDSITFDKIRGCQAKLKEVGISWRTAVDIGKARGVTRDNDEDEDEGDSDDVDAGAEPHWTDALKPKR
jgi:hypothetical protein